VFSSYFYEGLLQNAQLAYSKGKKVIIMG